jgi:chaperonin GroEL (HSP60 family)
MWLVICRLMRIRIRFRIKPITLIQIRIRMRIQITKMMLNHNTGKKLIGNFTRLSRFLFYCFFSLQEYRSLLEKCAATSMSSKLIHQQKEFFSKMVVDAVMMLDDLLPLNMIGIKKVQGGALEDTVLVPGVAFKKTFSYAGFEMQRKAYKNPKIALLNIELELKAEKDNAEVSDYNALSV